MQNILERHSIFTSGSLFSEIQRLSILNVTNFAECQPGCLIAAVAAVVQPGTSTASAAGSGLGGAIEDSLGTSVIVAIETFGNSRAAGPGATTQGPSRAHVGAVEVAGPELSGGGNRGNRRLGVVLLSFNGLGVVRIAQCRDAAHRFHHLVGSLHDRFAVHVNRQVLELLVHAVELLRIVLLGSLDFLAHGHQHLAIGIVEIRTGCRGKAK